MKILLILILLFLSACASNNLSGISLSASEDKIIQDYIDEQITSASSKNEYKQITDEKIDNLTISVDKYVNSKGEPGYIMTIKKQIDEITSAKKVIGTGELTDYVSHDWIITKSNVYASTTPK